MQALIDAVLAVLAGGKTTYPALLNSVDGYSPEKVARAVWHLRSVKRVKFTLVKEGAAIVHYVEAVN